MIRLTCAGAALLLTTAGIAYFAKPQEIAFAHLLEAQARLADTGFHFTSDRADGRLGTGFLLSRQASTWAEAITLRKVGPMGPEWKGKVWITFHSENWQLAAIPDRAGVRVWGAVVAFGDEEVLRDLDGILAPTSFSFL